jgi:NitT/TauT family transport system substrate-binding protein
MTRAMGVSRRLFSGAGLMAAATLAMPALGAQPKLEKSRLVMAVGDCFSLAHLPLTLARQLGYFKAEGLDIEFSDFSNGGLALQALLSGAADVCASAFEQAISQQSKNQFLQAFVVQARTPQVAFGVSTRSLPQYKSVADLLGRKIGIAAPGTSTAMMASLVLARAGLGASQASFVDVGTTQNALFALRSGHVDAICHSDPVMTMLEQKGDVKIISDARTLKDTLAVFGGHMPSACLYASYDFVQKNPNTCQAMTNAIVHSLKWLQTAGPGDMIKAVPEPYLLGDRALYLAAFTKLRESISPDGLMPLDGPRTVLRALTAFDPAIRAGRIDLSRTFNNEFALRAKARFKA